MASWTPKDRLAAQAPRDARAAQLLGLANGRGVGGASLADRGFTRVMEYVTARAGRAVFANESGELRLAIVAKDLSHADDWAQQRLRAEARNEAEAYAARHERQLLTKSKAGARPPAVGWACCLAPGKLEFGAWPSMPPAGYAVVEDPCPLLNKLTETFWASPFSFTPTSAAGASPASTVPGGGDLPTPTITWGSLPAAAKAGASVAVACAASPTLSPTTAKNLDAALSSAAATTRVAPPEAHQQEQQQEQVAAAAGPSCAALHLPPDQQAQGSSSNVTEAARTTTNLELIGLFEGRAPPATAAPAVATASQAGCTPASTKPACAVDEAASACGSQVLGDSGSGAFGSPIKCRSQSSTAGGGRMVRGSMLLIQASTLSVAAAAAPTTVAAVEGAEEEGVCSKESPTSVLPRLVKVAGGWDSRASTDGSTAGSCTSSGSSTPRSGVVRTRSPAGVAGQAAWVLGVLAGLTGGLMVAMKMWREQRA